MITIFTNLHIDHIFVIGQSNYAILQMKKSIKEMNDIKCKFIIQWIEYLLSISIIEREVLLFLQQTSLSNNNNNVVWSTYIHISSIW